MWPDLYTNLKKLRDIEKTNIPELIPVSETFTAIKNEIGEKINAEKTAFLKRNTSIKKVIAKRLADFEKISFEMPNFFD